jgi:hypothetical protein
VPADEALAGTVYLRIGDSAKKIPYEPSPRPNAPPSYGFKPLKGQPEAVRWIPEAHTDPALQDLLVAANDSSTAIFTIGCGSAALRGNEGHWQRGYVEFALNDAYAVQSFAEYFKVFLDFDGAWRAARGEYRVSFMWELAPALFLARDVEGYTFTVWIQTAPYATAEAARYCWGHALAQLRQQLVSVRLLVSGDAIY